MNVTWAEPAALLLLLLLPTYPYLARLSSRAIPLPRTGGLRAALRSARVTSALPDVLRTLVLATLILAVAGPMTPGPIVAERGEGVPIVLAVDISSSMLAQDFAPRDRLEVAKSTISRFIEGRAGDPIGLVAMAGEALTLVPPTMHRGVLQDAIQSLEVGLLQDGTALGDGLATAVNRLRYRDGGDGVIVLLTDGESNRGAIDPLDAAEAAAALGIQVHTIGVGTEGVAQVPVGAEPAGLRYAERPVGVDEELLATIASQTGGRYFRAADPAALERIYARIDEIVPSATTTTRRAEPTRWSSLLLLAGAILLFGEWALRGSRWGTLP